MNEQIRDVLTAHTVALEAQEAVQRAITSRADAIRHAIDSGVPVVELASALGVNRQRVYAMLKQ